MATTRTVCTECKSVVTLAEPAEVGDVATCPKCDAYFQVPRTKTAPAPGAAKPAAAQPAKPLAAMPAKPVAVPAKPKVVAVVEDDDEDDRPRRKRAAAADDDEDEDDDRPRKKKGTGKKKKKRRDDDEKSFRDSPLRYVILIVLVAIMGVGGYFLYKKEWVKPDLVVEAKDEDLGKPITEEQKAKAREAYEKNKANDAKGRVPAPNAMDRNKSLNELKQIGIAYINYVDAMGRGPASAAELKPYFENNSALADQISNGPYVVYWNVNVRTLSGGASNTILGYARGVNTFGGVALFADGSVRNVSKAEYDAASKGNK